MISGVERSIRGRERVSACLAGVLDREGVSGVEGGDSG